MGKNISSERHDLTGSGTIETRMAALAKTNRILRRIWATFARLRFDPARNAVLLEDRRCELATGRVRPIGGPAWRYEISRRDCRSCVVQSEIERSFSSRLENESDRHGQDRQP